MLVILWIRKIFKALSADAAPAAIAFGAAFGLLFGFVPFGTGLSFLLLLGILAFRIQLSSTLLFVGIGKLAMALGLYAPLANLGGRLLESASLEPFWRWFIALPVVAVSGIHQHVVLGALVAGVIAGALIFFPVRQLVIAYRRWAHDRLTGNRFFRWLMGFWLTKVLRFVFIGVQA